MRNEVQVFGNKGLREDDRVLISNRDGRRVEIYNGFYQQIIMNTENVETSQIAEEVYQLKRENYYLQMKRDFAQQQLDALKKFATARGLDYISEKSFKNLGLSPWNCILEMLLPGTWIFFRNAHKVPKEGSPEKQSFLLKVCHHRISERQNALRSSIALWDDDIYTFEMDFKYQTFRVIKEKVIYCLN